MPAEQPRVVTWKQLAAAMATIVLTGAGTTFSLGMDMGDNKTRLAACEELAAETAEKERETSERTARVETKIDMILEILKQR